MLYVVIFRIFALSHFITAPGDGAAVFWLASPGHFVSDTLVFTFLYWPVTLVARRVQPTCHFDASTHESASVCVTA